MQNLFCRLSNRSSLNSLSSENCGFAIVSDGSCLFSFFNCDCFRVSSISSLVAAARYECYAAKNSKREKYLFHFL